MGERERGGEGEGEGSSLDIHKCKQEVCQLDNRNPPKIRIREQRGGEARSGQARWYRSVSNMPCLL